MAITAALVNELRQKTNVGMMECKKALVACDGDMEKAIEHLRKAGIMKAEEKQGRSANQGIIVAKTNEKAGAFIEFLCETDFVAKTDDFKAYGAKLAEIALGYTEDGDVSAKLAAEVSEDLKVFIGRIKENMRIRRAIRWNTEGKIAYYIHTGNPFAAMVEVNGEASDEVLKALPMHIVASAPDFIDVADVPAEKVAKETEIALAQIPADKPEKMKQGIVSGKLNKWYGEHCLMKQPWLLDNKIDLSKAAPKLKVVRMVRWLAGEPLEGEA